MAKKTELTKQEEMVLETSLDQARVEKYLTTAADLETAEPAEPSMTDVGWSDYVLSQFTDKEKDPEGNPLVHGLRRVARKLLGPILKSQVKVIQPPTLIPSFERIGMCQPCTVECTVEILMCRLEQGMTEAYLIVFTECADIWWKNSEDRFLRHASSTAATKAEARCLRKALQLKAVAAEEMTKVPDSLVFTEGLINDSQINFLKILCSQIDVNLMKYVNSGKNRYDRVEDVPYEVAQKMVEKLSEYKRLQNVPDNLRGYEA